MVWFNGLLRVAKEVSKRNSRTVVSRVPLLCKVGRICASRSSHDSPTFPKEDSMRLRKLQAPR